MVHFTSAVYIDFEDNSVYMVVDLMGVVRYTTVCITDLVHISCLIGEKSEAPSS